MRDANGQVLGRVLASTREDVTVVTSAEYIVTIEWTGGFEPAQIYYTGSCAAPGTGFLNSGSGDNVPVDYITGQWMVFSGSLNSLVVPATVGANGTSASELLTANAIDNPACSAEPSRSVAGWRLRTITRAAAGLPATIAPPLTLE